MARLSCFAAAFVAGLFSLPVVAQAFEASVERTAPDQVVVHWGGADPVDVFVAARPDAPASASRRVARADTDGTYALTWRGAARPYVLLKDERNGEQVRVAERLLPLQQGSNFRDLGGYPAADGKHVRWGMIYRTGATPMLTDADWRYVQRLGLAADIDLRSTDERRIIPDQAPAHTGARYFFNDYPNSDIISKISSKENASAGLSSLYRGWLVSLAPQYRDLFHELLEAKGAVTYHCSAGQDRTGVATALLLSALGTPREVILADYHLSTQDRRPQYEIGPIDVSKFPNDPMAAYFAKGQAHGPVAPKPLYDDQGVAYLQHTFEEIDAHWGSVDAYLDKELGIGPREIARLRALYLE